MKASEVEVGGIYTTKVGVRSVDVRIERENPKGGWDASSIASGKPIRVKDAARLKPGKAQATEEATEGATGGEDKPAKRQRQPKQPKAAKAPKERKEPGKMSCLDAAAAVLKEAGEPLQTKTMVERMKEKGLWTTNAPTPAATLYSAILREMNTKGSESRFKKTDRGHFGLNA